MDQQTNPMMITVLVRCKGQVEYDQLIIQLKGIVNRFRRFRQRIVFPRKAFQRPYWEDAPAFRLENQVERVSLPLPADDVALGVLVNDRMNTMLDFNYPLWKITLVDNHPDGSIMIVRIHHTIGDGISLLRVFLLMTYGLADAALVQVDRSNGDLKLPDLESVMPKTMVEASLASPSSKPDKKVDFSKPKLWDIIAATARIIFRPPDPPSILKRPLGRVKKAVWSEPFSIPEIKKIALAKGATINDVLMALASGTIRRYMELHNDQRKHNLRAFIMVNMRGQTLDDELGNKFGLVFLTMPIEIEKPMERLDAIKNGMDFLKASAEYAASYVILNILGQLPGWIEHLATKFLDTKGTIVSTNVPGPRDELILAGAPIQSIIGWVPQSGRIGVGLSFISYNNQLIVGLNADTGVIPDPERFLELFAEEYNSFLALLKTSPQV